MTPYAFLVADNTPSVTFTFAVFVPACHVHVFTWQFSFLFQAYLATVPTNMVAYMWNMYRKVVNIRIIDALTVVKSMTGLSYRHLQGRLIETLSDEDSPCYTTIHRRFQALDVKRHDGVFAVTGGGTVPVRLAVDSTGLKQHSRGE